jgi:hypothetical protein
MALILNGSDGLSDVDGSASTPAIRGTDTNTGIFFPAADTIAFSEGGVESMRIDSAGNVGIGTSSPNTKLQVAGVIRCEATSGEGGQIEFLNTTNNAIAGLLDVDSSNNTRLLAITNNALTFGTNSTERMRIDSSGKLLVGTTTATPFAGLGIQGGIGFSVSNAYYFTVQSNSTDFYIGTQSLTRYAALAGLNTFTAWSFGSDRRIKYDIEDVKYGLKTVLDLKPRQYKFKDGDDFSIGFIAQELKEVVPEAVSGEEIAFDDADTPQERAKKTMGVSKDTLIPVLVKAIQEQQAIITDLKARLEVLEAK